MQHLMWKLRIALLWVAIGVTTPMRMLLVVTEPGVIDDLRAGRVNGMETSGPVTITWVLFFLVPLVMAVLTFVLPDGPGRWTNGILGVIFAGLWAFEIVGPTAAATLLNASVIVMSLLLAWLAWRWPAPRPTEAEHQRAPLG